MTDIGDVPVETVHDLREWFRMYVGTGCAAGPPWGRACGSCAQRCAIRGEIPCLRRPLAILRAAHLGAVHHGRYKTAEGKGQNKFGLEERAMDAAYATEVSP